MYSKIMFLVCGCQHVTKNKHGNELEKKGGEDNLSDDYLTEIQR